MEEENTEKTQGWSLQTHPGHSDPHLPGNVGPDLCSNSSTNIHTLMHIHAHTHTCTHPPTYTHAHTHTPTHPCTHMHPCTHTYTCARTYTDTRAHTHTHIHLHTHTPAHIHTHSYTLTCTHIYTNTHTHHTHTHLYTHPPKYTHTHLPTCTHTHTLHFPVLQTAPLTSHFHNQDRQLALETQQHRLGELPLPHPSPLTPSLFPPHLVPVHPSIHLLRPPCASGSTNTGNTPAPAPLGLTVQRDDRRSQTVVRTHGYQR